MSNRSGSIFLTALALLVGCGSPPPTLSTKWLATTRIPGATLTQVNPLPGSYVVAFQKAGGNPGCRMSTRLPMPNGPGSSRLMLFTVGVHSCHWSPLMTSQTRSVDAAMSTVTN